MIKDVSPPLPNARRVVPGRVTVITAVFNAAPSLAACIESVLSQSYGDIEYILMDGGSTDGSVDILRSYGDRIIWRSEPDRGIYDAWNKGVVLSSGEWISFLGADDYYLPHAITSYMNCHGCTSAEYICSHVRWVLPDGRQKTIGAEWSWPRFQSRMTTAHVGSMHRHTLFERYGRYDLSYRIVGDYEFLLRPRGSLRVAFLPISTAVMRAGGASDSFAALNEAYRAKVVTGGRNRMVAEVERAIAFAKLGVRRAASLVRGQ